ncbi:MAG TPA: rhodanese-like domain-containing protein [Pirellulaceae bacterium]|nr:rhodanese-like domain-containing protein [Pirellulaceae bacterium]
MTWFAMHGIGKVGLLEKPIPRAGSNDAIIPTTAALICTSHGFVANGMLRGEHPQVDIESILEAPPAERPFLLDVRSPQEFASDHISGAVKVPVDDLRSRLKELPSDRKIDAYCKVGQRGYLATRILLQTGYPAANVGGGYTTYKLFHPSTNSELTDRATKNV